MPRREERQWSILCGSRKASLGVHSINNFVNKMEAAAGLDVNKKHCTNHSIPKKIAVKKAGASAT